MNFRVAKHLTALLDLKEKRILEAVRNRKNLEHSEKTLPDTKDSSKITFQIKTGKTHANKYLNQKTFSFSSRSNENEIYIHTKSQLEFWDALFDLEDGNFVTKFFSTKTCFDLKSSLSSI